MLLFANSFALFFSFFAGYLATLNPLYALLSLSITALFAVVCSLLIKEVLKRSKGHLTSANLRTEDTHQSA